MTDKQLGYMAAMIDGEGHIILVRRQVKTRNYCYEPRVVVTNTSLILLSWIVKTTQLGTINPKGSAKGNEKDCYTWSISVDDQETFLTMIEPSLIVKAEQARLLLEYLKEYRGAKNSVQVSDNTQMMRNIIWEELRDLNA